MNTTLNTLQNITTATTTVVATSGHVILHCITFNGASVGATTIQDASAVVYATIAAGAIGTYWYKGVIPNGLSIVTAGASNITVSYSKM